MQSEYFQKVYFHESIQNTINLISKVKNLIIFSCIEIKKASFLCEFFLFQTLRQKMTVDITETPTFVINVNIYSHPFCLSRCRLWRRWNRIPKITASTK